VEKVSEASILSGALVIYRLYNLTTAETARKKLKEESGKVVQKYSEIRVY
jgi:hypothetical protein